MTYGIKPDPAVIVIFGASGDLTARKVVPALYNLYLDDYLPAQYSIVGVSRTPFSDDEFRTHLRSGIEKFSRRGTPKEKEWSAFAGNVHYLQAEYNDSSLYQKLLELDETSWSTPPNLIFYLATPPNLFPEIISQLGNFDLLRGDSRYRIVIEKPFGHDLKSAQKLNQELTQVFREHQIYRIDHYLGKETVQNILAFRFGNAVWEPIWNRNFIDHIQITVAEQIGIGRRGGYYESAGALRDMMQNHLLQLLCFMAMEPPTSFDADEIRNKKVDVMHAIRLISREEVPRFAVRGQYGGGLVEGEPVPSYRAETGVRASSNTETFAALKLFIDNWRWQGVPFYLRTGKRMPARVSEISLQFRPVPHHPFSHLNTQLFQPNRLVIQIEPNEGIVLRTLAKEPGLGMKLKQVDMQYCYHDVFKTPSPDAYETLLVDILRDDPGLFMRADQVEAAWRVLDPILEVWRSNQELNFPNYQPGQWGPPEAEHLIAQDRRTWLPPVCAELKRG
ncbi:glucose-6-phosphate dehydrogenase [Propionispora hippei]|uniref:Glucose-6-phosphate 1-dehydrogenase n=1 Tax=Propionispora hippei DSM 15287 TaxID=1123003 RepID=A0A1M6BXH0_9FIRM|nr:glucose-6-phosphate dehydrogenase [Propionispora hippei]SHI53485.1 glucose-6-phosphate 1-dehydrogenase [Propionispora hippei DSM 15287]